MTDPQVIVVGAGPVGTVAAYRLASMGIDVLLVEAGRDCAIDLRASTFHPPTLEMLDELGMAETLIARGLKAPEYHFRERATGELVSFDLSELADETRFPYRLQCEQYVLASMVAKKLDNHPRAEVRFNHRLVSFTQDENGVEVALEGPFAIEKVRAKYLVAADGGNSIVRKWLGVDFEGFTYPERFLTLSTKVELRDYIENLACVNYVSDPQEWLVLLRVPSAWRILVPAKEDQPDEWLVSDEKKNEVFRKLIGREDVETGHRTIYRVHQRVATRFDHGRIGLVGDAAHLNNPLGGFGMNSGIHDAWCLCDKIKANLDKGHDDTRFEAFDAERRPVTHRFIQAQTMQNKKMLEHSPEENHAQRLQEMKDIRNDPVRRRAFLRRQAMFESLEESKAAIQE
ncbi:NAD(P)/FAD-dependent oxidoreductase [Microbulbifer bruguierae]|uniref:NAD(P)/FAD-dependent oxidoreductase n=1 Tax=Microbulbifer bruguierae TaxID=3029061 RepID=A0ABY8NDY7_9GAMM|nr:NAD(P)/FAD-dependent oxidoreductase [Microbulbifer bruguierae]WGL16297.1 NAD(P)/FAD-dependent oxidoreductase [Microbulbifer bruguierae]